MCEISQVCGAGGGGYPRLSPPSPQLMQKHTVCAKSPVRSIKNRFKKLLLIRFLPWKGPIVVQIDRLVLGEVAIAIDDGLQPPQHWLHQVLQVLEYYRVTFALWCSPLDHLSDKKFLSEADEIWSAASREAGQHREKNYRALWYPGVMHRLHQVLQVLEYYPVTFTLWCGPLYHLSDKKFLSEADEIWSAASREAGQHREKNYRALWYPGVMQL